MKAKLFYIVSGYIIYKDLAFKCHFSLKGMRWNLCLSHTSVWKVIEHLMSDQLSALLWDAIDGKI